MKHSYFKSSLLVFLCVILAFSSVSCAKIAQDKLAEESAAATTPEIIVDEKQEEVSEQEPQEEVTSEPDFTPEPEPEPDKIAITEQKIINPLTGEEVVGDTSMNRPIAFMINNHSAAMPQLGVANADIIYEMIVEGGITRLFAVFQNLSNEDIVGSIRSSRHNYLDLVKAYDALYVHAGGSPQAYEKIKTRDIDNVCGVTGRGDLFYRDQNRLATMAFEHTLCIKGETILNYFANESGYRLEHNEDYVCNMQFSDEIQLIDSQTANVVDVNFGYWKTSTFEYNPESGKYSMMQFGDVYRDGNTDQPVEFKNVIVIQTSVVSIDGKDRKEITLTGSGNGWFICNGEIAEVTWSRSDNDSQFEYTYSDGTPITYGVGKTYVCVIAKAGNIDFE